MPVAVCTQTLLACFTGLLNLNFFIFKMLDEQRCISSLQLNFSQSPKPPKVHRFVPLFDISRHAACQTTLDVEPTATHAEERLKVEVFSV